MNYPLDIHKVSSSHIGQELYSEIAQASWGTMSPFSIPDLSVAIGTSIGSVRQRNEDRVAVAKVYGANGIEYFVTLVCDGVGSSDMGDVAASIAVAVFLDELVYTSTRQSLEFLVPELVRRVDERVRDILQGRGATTLSVLVATASGDIVATNVGDSRIYAWSPQKDKLMQVSRDDTLENEFSELALKDPSALRLRGLGGSLSQAIGETGRTSNDLRVKLLGKELFPDGAVLATDGAWKGAEDGFNAVVKKAPTAANVVSRALSVAYWSGGIDNASLVAVERIRATHSVAYDFSITSPKISVWIANTKLVLGDPAFSSSGRYFTPEVKDRPVMKADIRRALKKKYLKPKNEPKTPEQLDFKIVEDTPSPRKKDPRADLEVSIEPTPKKESDS
ncbi:TPA: PP2C family protein-serine/threonine phosphatase [Pseudomonas aeruginosa]